ncbi:VOC family protein [Sandarakinorhabdus sp.]|uniref:VOC family protein n=1 Tax=Sandarakinorhabdus sp. TaxID=1916663 RepID=UPI003F6EB76D
MFRLRQIAVVAPELAPVVAAGCATLGADVCFRDPGVAKFGLENALWSLGGTFLEALAPITAGTTAGRYLDRRGGPTGYMLILDSDDLAPVRLRLAMMNIRIVEDVDVRQHGASARALHLHPRDTGGCLLSIDHHAPDPGMMGSYAWAGPDWHRHTNPGLTITGAVIACENPQVIAMRWSTMLVQPWQQRADRWRLQLNHGSIDFVAITDDRGEGLSAIRIAGLAAPTRLSGLDLLPD